MLDDDQEELHKEFCHDLDRNQWHHLGAAIGRNTSARVLTLEFRDEEDFRVELWRAFNEPTENEYIRTVWVDVSHTNITDTMLAIVAELPIEVQIQSLWCQNCPRLNGYSLIIFIDRGLNRLSLQASRSITDNNVKNLAKIRTLEMLNLGRCYNIREATLSHLKSELPDARINSPGERADLTFTFIPLPGIDLLDGD